MSGKPEDTLDISGYENCCETETVEDGKPTRWLRRTRITMETGTILGIRANDMSCKTCPSSSERAVNTPLPAPPVVGNPPC
nr:hypothetical protein [uncultured Oscillibacter sp.]